MGPLIDLLKAVLESVNVQNNSVIDQVVEQFIDRLPKTVKAKLAA
jgi:hypothetical protein